MPGQNVGDAALPHMGWGAGLIDDISVRLSRVSFSGERAYEIFVPASRGAAAWDLVLQAGVEFGIAPYGVDAMNALRIEKGHVTGAEINGRTTPNDLGLTRMLKRDGDFIGRRSLARTGLAYCGRWQLVGLAAEDGATPLPQGGKVVADPRRTVPNPILGEITSTAWSPTLDAPIGLALLADGRSRHGELVYAVSPLFDQEVAVRVRPPVFFDPKGEKLRG
jgi:sarcosine oxidase, subunit alpha